MVRFFSTLWRGLAVFAACGSLLAMDETRAAQAGRADSDLAFAMSLDVGRLETIVSKAGEAAEAIASMDTTFYPDNAREGNEQIFQDLKLVVLEYNLLVTSTCGAVRAHPEFCRELYLPDWLRDPSARRHDSTRLRTLIKDANAKITPFWIDVCAAGKTATGDTHFCELE